MVIENVERIMDEERLDPRAATRKAMGQITGAIIAITVVLAAVFVPSALQPGATGIIYSQFALTIALSMGFSAFLALSFTPSLCAAILKPRHDGEQKKNVVFRWFDTGIRVDPRGLHRPSRCGRASCAALDGGLRIDHGGGGISLHAPAHELRPR